MEAAAGVTRKVAAFQHDIAVLYPELSGSAPDPERFAESIIVRVLNFESIPLVDSLLVFYGFERVRAVAQAQVNRLDAPVYRRWRERLDLPERDEMVERFHRMWRP